MVIIRIVGKKKNVADIKSNSGRGSKGAIAVQERKKKRARSSFHAGRIGELLRGRGEHL